MIIPNQYKDIVIPNPTKEVFICTKEDGNIEVLNASNEKIFADYGKVQAIEISGSRTSMPYEKSVLKYEKDKKFGLINFEGKAITKPIYEEISSVMYKEGEILAKKDGKYGVINNKGVVLIPFKYDGIEADRYYNGSYEKSGYIVKIQTSEGYRYGYINYKGKEILKLEYTDISRIIDIEDNKGIYFIAAKNRSIWSNKK